MQDIERQLDALRHLQHFLLTFIENLRENMQLYNRKVDGLRESGLPLQISDNYEVNYCRLNNQQLEQVVENMLQADLNYININIAHFEEALIRARSAY
jgi:hypothetical protein